MKEKYFCSKKLPNLDLYLSIGAPLEILGLLMTLFLHDCHYEIDINLVLGEKKSKITHKFTRS